MWFWKCINGRVANPPDKWGLRELIWKRIEGFEKVQHMPVKI